MKEWTTKEAMEVVLAVIMEETNESALSDKEAEELAAKIVAALDKA